MYETEKDRAKNALINILYIKIIKTLEIPSYMLDFVRIKLHNSIENFFEDEQERIDTWLTMGKEDERD